MFPPAFWARPRYSGGVTRKSKPVVKARSLSERNAYRRLEDVVGCKWSAAVVAAIGRGVTRPGQLERFIPGISTKVLNERLRKLLDYALIEREETPGKIPRVDYRLTDTGRKLGAILQQLRDLDEEHGQRQAPCASRPGA
jgi:DNA-binding HxlR family transcriptional regulator